MSLSSCFVHFRKLGFGFGKPILRRLRLTAFGCRPVRLANSASGSLPSQRNSFFVQAGARLSSEGISNLRRASNTADFGRPSIRATSASEFFPSSASSFSDQSQKRSLTAGQPRRSRLCLTDCFVLFKS